MHGECGDSVMGTIAMHPDYAAQIDAFEVGFDAEDRAGRLPQRRRSRVVRRLLIVAIVSGAGWATYQDPSIWSRAWTFTEALASGLFETASKLPTPTAKPVDSLPPIAPPTEARPLQHAALPARPEPPFGAKPVDPVPAPVAAIAPAPTPSKPAQVSATASKPYTAPPPKALDPKQARAQAAGLHPDLPPAALAKLSETDIDTVATAIRKALAETDDAHVLIWPARPRAQAAQFRISFVEGENAGCRRYVVAIGKDGWQTTALPVEKCGVKRSARR